MDRYALSLPDVFALSDIDVLWCADSLWLFDALVLTSILASCDSDKSDSLSYVLSLCASLRF